MASPFASELPSVVVDLAAYPGQSVTIRKLSGLQFQAARTAIGSFRAAVLKAGIVSWTFEKPVSPEAVDDLDEDSAEFIASEIILLTKPSLKQTAEQAEAAQKNG